MKRASLPADVPQTRCYMAACCQIDECARQRRLKLKNEEASVCKTLENTLRLKRPQRRPIGDAELCEHHSATLLHGATACSCFEARLGQLVALELVELQLSTPAPAVVP